jgi:hypothetical protein
MSDIEEEVPVVEAEGTSNDSGESAATPEALASIAESLGLGSEQEKSADDNKEAASAVKEPPTAPVEKSPEEEAPKTWRKEAAAEWAAVPKSVREEILKREADMFKGIENYKADAAIGTGLKTIVQPYLAQIREANADPMQIISGLLESHSKLLTLPIDQRQALFERLAESYGVQVTAKRPEDAPYADPEITGLRTTVEGLQRDLQARRDQEIADIHARNKKEIDEFASKPENIYFNEVAGDVARLLKAGIAGSLSDAYEQAVRLNPVTYAKEVARATAAATEQARKDAAERARKARTATGANLSTRPNNGAGTGPAKSWQEGVDEAYTAIMARG